MKRIALIIGVLLAGSSTAHADSAGPIQYQPPWPSYPGKAPGAIFQDEGSSAQIIVEGPYELSAEAAAAQSWPSGGKVEAEYEVTVAGNPGYMQVRKKGKQKVASAATVIDGAAYVFTVVAKKGDYDAAVEAWGAMVDGAWIGGGGEAAAEPSWEPSYEYDQAPAESGGGGSGGGGSYDRAYTVTLYNGASDCTAYLTIDGQSYSINAGDTSQVQLSEGNHTIGWTNRDGTTGEYTYNVPDLTEFTASCKKPKKGQSASREEAEEGGGGGGGGGYEAPAPAPSSGYSQAEIQRGAESWVNLYYMAQNLMSWSSLFPNEFVINGLVEDLSTKAASNDALAAELIGSFGKEQSIADQWNAGDDATRYQLQRAAAEFTLNVAGQDGLTKLWGDNDCGSSDDIVGCWIQTATNFATAFYEASAKKQQAMRDHLSARIISEQTTNFVFTNLMNSPGMQFQPVSW